MLLWHRMYLVPATWQSCGNGKMLHVSHPLSQSSLLDLDYPVLRRIATHIPSPHPALSPEYVSISTHLAWLMSSPHAPLPFSTQKPTFVTWYWMDSPLSTQGSSLPRASILFQSQETGVGGHHCADEFCIKRREVKHELFWYLMLLASCVLPNGRFWWN